MSSPLKASIGMAAASLSCGVASMFLTSDMRGAMIMFSGVCLLMAVLSLFAAFA